MILVDYCLLHFHVWSASNLMSDGGFVLTPLGWSHGNQAVLPPAVRRRQRREFIVIRSRREVGWKGRGIGDERGQMDSGEESGRCSFVGVRPTPPSDGWAHHSDLIVNWLDKLEFLFERLTPVLCVDVFQGLVVQILNTSHKSPACGARVRLQLTTAPSDELTCNSSHAVPLLLKCWSVCNFMSEQNEDKSPQFSRE